jgi:hypothetical protein
MKEQIQRYEDRYGSSDFEDGKGANLQKLVDRKEKREMKQNGIKPTDTFADKVKKVIAEENPSKKKKENADMQDAEAVKYLKSKGLSDENIEKVMKTPYGVDALKQSNNEDEKNDVLDDDGNNQMRDEEEEKRIKIMQYMNPRIVKSSEVKNFMDRTNVKEEIIHRLNELASHKLDLHKKALAINAPVELGIVPKDSGQPKKYSTGDISVQKMMSNAAKRIGDLTPGQISNAVAKAAINATPIGTAMGIISSAQNMAKIISSKIKNKPVEPVPMPNTQAPGQPTPMPQAPKPYKRFPQQQFAEEAEQLDEGNVIRQGRTKIVKARVRGGKVQRRKKLSAVKGYTIRGGKLKRMSMQERIRRKRGQRRGKVKRKAKMARALMRRKRSMRKRASLGLKE